MAHDSFRRRRRRRRRCRCSSISTAMGHSSSAHGRAARHMGGRARDDFGPPRVCCSYLCRPLSRPLSRSFSSEQRTAANTSTVKYGSLTVFKTTSREEELPTCAYAHRLPPAHGPTHGCLCVHCAHRGGWGLSTALRQLSHDERSGQRMSERDWLSPPCAQYVS